MKIRLSPLYRCQFALFTAFGLLIILGVIVFTVFYGFGTGFEKAMMLFLGILSGLALIGFPFCLNHRQLSHVCLEETGCSAYSLLNQRLCQVEFQKPVFYAFFDVRFPYAAPVRFIALSNHAFFCDHKRFYGTYDRKNIIIFPCDAKTAAQLRLDDWQRLSPSYR